MRKLAILTSLLILYCGSACAYYEDPLRCIEYQQKLMLDQLQYQDSQRYNAKQLIEDDARNNQNYNLNY